MTNEPATEIQSLVSLARQYEAARKTLEDAEREFAIAVKGLETKEATVKSARANMSETEKRIRSLAKSL